MTLAFYSQLGNPLLSILPCLARHKTPLEFLMYSRVLPQKTPQNLHCHTHDNTLRNNATLLFARGMEAFGI